MKLDFNLFIDGVTQSGATKDDFRKALDLVKSGNYRSTPQDRAAMLNLLRFSDFLSGGANGKTFEPAIFGFVGEPKNIGAYITKDSAPDVELKYTDVVRIFGQEFAEQFAFDPSVTDVTNRTIEIKQKLRSSQTTFTQLGAKSGFAQEIERIRAQAEIKEKVGKDGRVSIKASLYDDDRLFAWFESPEQTKYRNALITQFEQKMQNYLLFAYTDGKLSVKAFPGLAKEFNLRKSAARRRQMTSLEFTGGATGGSVALRASAEGDRLIREKAIDVTSQIQNAVEKNFGRNLLNFYLNGDGAAVFKKTGANTKYGFVNGIAEILIIIKEFDPKAGGKPFTFEGQVDDTRMGTMTSKAKMPKQRARAQSQTQQGVSAAQITELARRAFVQKMPKGQINGPPAPVEGILTYRSGRFAQSFNILTIDERANKIRYTYDPIYRVHEATSRNPRTLIESAIRNVVQRKLGKMFGYISQ